jgi:hypothetical protein
MRSMTPCEWAKPIEGELWEVIQSMDEAKLAIVTQLREQDSPDEELKRFSGQFDSARGGLQKILLDAVSPETEDGTGETEPKSLSA